MTRRAIIQYGFDELFFDDDNGARQDAGSRRQGEKSSTPSSSESSGVADNGNDDEYKNKYKKESGGTTAMVIGGVGITSSRATIGLSTTSLTTVLSGFNLADFIAPEVAKYVGVRSLVRFGATSKYNFMVMTNEIDRRKKCVAYIEEEVVRLMTCSHPFHIPSLSEYSRASAAATYAMNLIDDEVNILRSRMCTKSNVRNIWSGWSSDEYKWIDSDVFLEERKKFLDYDRFYPGPLHILPRCFYFPPKRDLKSPSPEIVLEASSMAWQIWIAYEGWEDLFSDSDNDSESDQDSYYECVKDTAHVLARDSHNGMIDAFRIVARELFYSEPNSRACLWSTLEMADKFESQTLGMARRMRGWLHRA